MLKVVKTRSCEHIFTDNHDKYFGRKSIVTCAKFFQYFHVNNNVISTPYIIICYYLFLYFNKAKRQNGPSIVY